jgi:glutathione peroxidase
MALALGITLTFGSAAPAASAAPATQPAQPSNQKSPLDFTVQNIDGKAVNLDQYRGKVVLIVNVASKCGNTPQYAGLEKMYEQYKDQGLVILGFPANNFGHQEPGTNSQIKTFCTSKYDVTFPMFSKISVKGDDMAPLYQFLTRQKTAPKPAGNVSWNFEKFLVGRDGDVIARFTPKTKPDNKELVAAVQTALKGQ